MGDARAGAMPAHRMHMRRCMNTKKQKKLKVARETILVLGERELGVVRGGLSLAGHCYKTDASGLSCCPTTNTH